MLKCSGPPQLGLGPRHDGKVFFQHYCSKVAAGGCRCGCRLSSARCSGDAVVEVVELPAAGGHMVTLATAGPDPLSCAQPAPHHRTLPGQRTLTSLHHQHIPAPDTPLPHISPPGEVRRCWCRVWRGLGWAGTRNTRQRGRKNNYTFTGAGHRSYLVLTARNAGMMQSVWANNVVFNVIYYI